MTSVKIFDIEADVIPCGLCALLVPHADSEENLTTQQSLDKMPKHQLALFAAIQVVEWGMDEGPKDDAAETPAERMDAIRARFQRATQERMWREIYAETRMWRGR